MDLTNHKQPINFTTFNMALTFNEPVWHPYCDMFKTNVPKPRFEIGLWKYNMRLNLYISNFYVNIAEHELKHATVLQLDRRSFWRKMNHAQREYTIRILIQKAISEEQVYRVVNGLPRISPLSEIIPTRYEVCPQCNGKAQSLGGGNYFCLDCEWDNMDVLP